jgi:ABC-type glycerol-3-phosphate transport system substrate-binding protein
MKVRVKFAAGLLAAGMLLAAGCGGSGGSGGGSDKLTLVAYSTPREAYEQLIGRPEPRRPERPGRRRRHPGP